MDKAIEQHDEDLEILFELPAETVLEKSEGDGEEKRRVKGYASTEALDKDRETILQKGIDFEPLKSEGFINYDHQRRNIDGVSVPMIIGTPTDVVMKSKGLWVEGILFNGDPMASEQDRLANEMWCLGQNLQKSGRSLSFSIEGSVLARHGKKIIKSVAKMVAMTHKPVNSECSVETFAKSLCCGRCSPSHPEYNPAHPCSSKKGDAETLNQASSDIEKAASLSTNAPMLLENLDRNITSVLYGDKECGCFKKATGEFYKGIQGAHEHMTGCLGHDSDTTFRFLKRLINKAVDNENLGQLARTAGFVRQ